MNVYKVPVKGYFAVNCYFLIDEDTGHGFLIDPGAQGNEIARIIQPEDTEYRDIDELLWEQFGMEDTTETIRDAVFLLSYEDILHYFPGENTLFCPGASAPGTEWARAQAETDDMCWWLRSASAQAGYVNIVSPVNSVGACIDAKGTRHGVRPALWLKLDR